MPTPFLHYVLLKKIPHDINLEQKKGHFNNIYIAISK